jgi:5-methylcytosine-specific restriction protein A
VVAAIAQGPDKLVNALLNGVEEASEGRVLTVLHLLHERSPALVGSKKALAIKRDNGKLVCEGCGFDFSVHYGDRGHGFLECHHTRPVHAMAEGDITSLEDLALLCANCHRMVHTKRPWLTVPELKELVQTMRLKR